MMIDVYNCPISSVLLHISVTRSHPFPPSPKPAIKYPRMAKIPKAEFCYIQKMKKQAQLSNQIKKLQYQLSYSEHINKELSSQLAGLCAKLGTTPNKLRQYSEICVINTQTHLQQLYYIEPLLMCYEETLHLLKSELDESKEQALAILENTEKIVSENTFLRKQLQSKIQLLVKADNLGLTVNFLTLDNRDLKDKISIINARNDFLARKNLELEQQLQSAQSDNLKLFDHTDMSQLEQRLKEDAKTKETELINCKTEIEVLRNQLNNERTIVGELEKKTNLMENEVLKFKNEAKIAKQQLQSNQTIQQRVKQTLDTELLSLKQQLSASQRKQQQLFTKCMSLQSQLQDKGNRIHNTNIQNSQLQANNNNMLQMLESYEVKVSSLNKKIKQLQNELKEINEENAECAKRAEIAEWKLTEKNQQAERRETEWKKQRGRINKMWEDRLQAVRKNYDILPINKL